MADIQLTKPAANQTQTVTSASDARFVLNFSTGDAKLSKSENGENLVMTFDDGAKIEVEGFYTTFNKDSLPTLQVGGADITGEQLAAVLGEDLMPAAGPGARQAAMPAGGRFRSFADADLNGGLDRLGGLEIGFTDGVQLYDSPDNWYKVNGDPEVSGLDVEGGTLTLEESGVFKGGNEYNPGIAEVRGRINATDPEGKPLTFTFEDGSNSITTAHGVITLDKTSGEVVYRLDNSDPDTNALAQDTVVSQKFTVIVSDPDGGSATVDFVVNIKGTNDKPELTLGGDREKLTVDDNGNVHMTFVEDGVTSKTGTATSTDVDTGHKLGYTATLKAATHSTDGELDLAEAADYGKLTFEGTSPNGDTSVFRYTTSNDGKVQTLGAGESVTLTYEVRVQDEWGAWDTKQVTVTINGIDDVQVVTLGDVLTLKAEGVFDADLAADKLITGATDWNRSEPGAADGNQKTHEGENGFSADGVLNHGEHLTTITRTIDIQDPDAHDTHTVVLTGASSGPGYSTVIAADGQSMEVHYKAVNYKGVAVDHIVATVTLGTDADGKPTYTVEMTEAAKYMPEGAEFTANIGITVTAHSPDGSTHDVTETVAATFKGSNDAPTLDIKADSGFVLMENASVRTLTGKLSATDVDVNENLDTANIYLVDNDGTVLHGEGWSVINPATAKPYEVNIDGYGKMTLDASGKYTFTLFDNAKVKALEAGKEYHLTTRDDGSYTFAEGGEGAAMFRVYDGHDAYSEQVIDIVIKGTNNNAALISSTVAVATVKESGVYDATDSAPNQTDGNIKTEDGGTVKGQHLLEASGKFTLQDADDNAFVGGNAFGFSKTDNGVVEMDVTASMLGKYVSDKWVKLTSTELRNYGLDNNPEIGTIKLHDQRVDQMGAGDGTTATTAFTFTLNDAAVDKVPQGTTLTVKVPVYAFENGAGADGVEKSIELVNIMGTNDKPTLTLPESYVVSETGAYLGATPAKATAVDADYYTAAPRFYVMVDGAAKPGFDVSYEGEPVGSFSIDSSTGAYGLSLFSAGKAKLEALTAEERLYLHKSDAGYYLSKDPNGAVEVTIRTYDQFDAWDEKSLSITMQGKDTAPTIMMTEPHLLKEAGVKNDGNIDEAGIPSVTGKIDYTDPDSAPEDVFFAIKSGTGYVHELEVKVGDGVIAGGKDFGLDADAVVGKLVLDKESGAYTFSITNQDAIDALPANEALTFDFAVQAGNKVDAGGQYNSNVLPLTFVISGTNDKPSISVPDETTVLRVQEDAVTVGEFTKGGGEYKASATDIEFGPSDAAKVFAADGPHRGQSEPHDVAETLTYKFTNQTSTEGATPAEAGSRAWVVRAGDHSDAAPSYTLVFKDPFETFKADLKAKGLDVDSEEYKEAVDLFLCSGNAPVGELSIANADWSKWEHEWADGKQLDTWCIKGIGSAGEYTFTLNNNHPDVQKLNNDETLGGKDGISVNIMVVDKNGAFDIKTVKLAIDGKDDPTLGPSSVDPVVWTEVSVPEAMTEQGVIKGTNTPNDAADTTGWQLLEADYGPGLGVKYSYTVEWGSKSVEVDASHNGSIVTGHGTLLLKTVDGKLYYQYDVANETEAVQQMKPGESATDSFTVTAHTTANTTSGSVTVDSDALTLTVRIEGANDRPVFTVSGADAPVDASGIAHFTTDKTVVEDSEGTWKIKDEQLSSRDYENDTVTYTLLDGDTPAQVLAGTYGIFTLQENGTYTYELTEAGNQALQVLGEGQTIAQYNAAHPEAPLAEESFNVRVTDAHNASNDGVLTINIVGKADGIAGVTTRGTVQEDGGAFVAKDSDESFNASVAATISTTGKVQYTASEAADATGATFTLEGDGKGEHGTLVVDAEGNYTYTLNNPAVQQMAVGESYTETFTVQVTSPSGHTAKSTVQITIEGTNDAPYFVDAGDNRLLDADSRLDLGEVQVNNSARLMGDGTLPATEARDTDTSDTLTYTFGKGGACEGTYGTFVLGENGEVTYYLNNWGKSAQELKEDALETATFKVDDGHGGYDTIDVSVTVKASTDSIGGGAGGDKPELGDNHKLEDTALEDDGNVLRSGESYDKFVIADGYLDFGGKELSWQHMVGFGTDEKGQMQVMQGKYGFITMNGKTGEWEYRLDNSLPEVQELNADEVLGVEEFAVYQAGKPLMQNGEALIVKVEVKGTNDAPVIETVNTRDTNPDDAFDLVVAQGDPSSPASVSGQIGDIDTDRGGSLGDTPTYWLVDAHGAKVLEVQGTYGKLTIDQSTGEYTYTVTDSTDYTSTTHEVETFKVMVEDSYGASDTAEIKVQFNGSNNPPTLQDVELQHTVTEDAYTGAGLVQASYSLADHLTELVQDDRPLGEQSFSYSLAGGTLGGTFLQLKYGTVRMSADGTYTYTLNNRHADVQGLNTDSQSLTETFKVLLTDGDGGSVEKEVNITINGTNDNPTLSLETPHLIVREGDSPVTRKAHIDDIDDTSLQCCFVDAGGATSQTMYMVWNDVTSEFALQAALPTGEVCGTLTIDNAGNYTLALNNAAAAVQNLESKDLKGLDVTVRVTDGHGGSDEQNLHITVRGDSGTITPPPTPTTDLYIDAALQTAYKAVRESGYTAALDYVSTDTQTGNLKEYIYCRKSGDSVDEEATNTLRFGVARSYTGEMAGKYGTLRVNVDGTFEYKVNNYNEAVNALDNGKTLPDTFTLLVWEVNNPVPQRVNVTFTINGSNDKPVLKFATPDDANLQLVEDETLVKTGQVKATDPEGHAVTYGISINGAEYTYAAGAPVVLTGADVDATYGGTLTLNPDGTYSYQVDSTNAAVNALGEGKTAELTFYVNAKDAKGLASSQGVEPDKLTKVTITITGTNDAPVIDTVEAPDKVLHEGAPDDHPETQVSGFIKVLDVDTTPDKLTVSIVEKNGKTTHGKAEVAYDTETGQWKYTYTLTANGPVKAGDDTDTFHIQVFDGLTYSDPYEVTVQLYGYNQAPKINKVQPETLELVEDDKLPTGKITASDPDGDTLTYVVEGPCYARLNATGDGLELTTDSTDPKLVGTFTVDANGTFRFDLKSDVIDHWDEKVSDSVSFTVKVSDPSEASVMQTVTVKITGHNDKPEITLVEEGSISASDTASISGQLTATDVEKHDLSWGIDTKSGTVEQCAGEYGTLTIVKNPDGTFSYSYTTNDKAKAIGNGVTKDDEFTLVVDDGHGGKATETLKIHVTGDTNHKPTLNAKTEKLNMPTWEAAAAAFATVEVSGKMSKSLDEDDLIDSHTYTASGTGKHGTLVMQENGDYTYTLNSPKPDADGNLSAEDVALLQMRPGEELDTFKVTVEDSGGETSTADLVIKVGQALSGDYKFGDAGNNNLIGTDKGDVIFGNAGDDKIYGGSGNDKLYGGSGSDTLYGGDGNDALHGGSGDDFLYGGAGNDSLFGGDGNDVLFGGDGADSLFGEAGNDFLDGGAGADSIEGGAGHDLIIYDRSDFLVDGGDGTDFLVGAGSIKALFNDTSDGTVPSVSGVEVAVDTNIKVTSMDDLLNKLNLSMSGDKIALQEATDAKNGWAQDTNYGGDDQYNQYVHHDSNGEVDATMVVLKSVLEHGQG